MSKFFSNRLLGVIFIGLLALGVWVVNGVFNQKFTSFDRVTLTADSIGLQLPNSADVKVRGVIVGQVLDISSNAAGATLTLGIKPDRIDQIPDNVTASILPKTLFGEKYVELVVPPNRSNESLRAGDKITQTVLPIEVEKVLNDFFPLLTAIQPEQLNYTLNAIATALEGRGDAIGQNIEVLDSYLKRLNPELPKLVQDLRLLGTVAGTYADVTPQIAATLRNTIKTGNTLLTKKDKLNAFLTEVASFSNTTKAFLDKNGDNIIRLGRLSAPQAKLLARYAPEYPCLLRGLVNQIPQLASTFRGYVFHINLVTLPRQPRGYTANDVPLFGATNGPQCLGLPNPKVPFNNIPNFADGVDNLQRGDAQRTAPAVDPFASNAAAGEGEQAVVAALTAPLLGVPAEDVDGLTTLMMGPLFAGSEVSVQ